jgi:hypothetical protein
MYEGEFEIRDYVYDLSIKMRDGSGLEKVHVCVPTHTSHTQPQPQRPKWPDKNYVEQSHS